MFFNDDLENLLRTSFSLEKKKKKSWRAAISLDESRKASSAEFTQ
jgi:hypothetical protein